jgi:hypothetical protein
MRDRPLGLVLFGLGAFALHLYTTLLFLWALAGLPFATFPLMLPVGVRWRIGFAPPIGAVLLLVAGLVYGRSPRELVA